MRIVAVIPTRYEPDRLEALLAVVRPEVDLCLVLDNGHDPSITDAIDVRGLGIYAMWNKGWHMAREWADGGPFDLAVLNDDIVVLPGTLPFLSAALRADDSLGAVTPQAGHELSIGLPSSIRYMSESGKPGIDRDPTTGRTINGYCFVFRGELELPPFDEGMEWWYGDSEFDESVKLAGYGCAVIDRVPIEHNRTAIGERRPDLIPAMERDGVRWAELHHTIREGRWWPRSS